jgi:hydroxymethylbilane synthase
MNKEKSIRVGTRGSALALTQTNWVAERIKERHPGVLVEVVTIKTTGDRLHDVPLAKIGGKGVFVKEIEECLLAGDIDFAVHSMKDVPAEIPEGLEIGIVPEREDPRDVLISRGNRKLGELRKGARVGTGSLRRGVQLRHNFPYVHVVPIRGNLDTRIRKIETEGLDGIIVAAAGVNRMGWTDRVSQSISPETIIPAIGQGALAIEVRRDDNYIGILGFLDHEDSRIAVTAERAFLKVFGGGCQLPIAAHGKRTGSDVIVTGFVGNLDGGVVVRDHVSGPAAEAEKLGRDLAERILSKGGREILQEAYRCMNEK